ncbi:MAG: alkaline phosphatase family protein [Bdellovibrionaceae bacterium]|nr:alkaline phosphatase family protein [Pseudobdellovibrionaceae bacterium]
MRGRCFFTALLLSFFATACTHTAPAPVPAVPPRNAEVHRQKPLVVMISIDGCRHDDLDHFSPPNLLKLRREGVTSRGLIPVYPSQTFPNHYTLATGLTAEHHGLLGNQFYDPQAGLEYRGKEAASARDGRWYGGLPLWGVAQKAGMLSGVYFWIGSEAEIAGTRPTEFFHYDDKVTIDARIDQALEWMKRPPETRPPLIMLYFADVDMMGHRFGPHSPEVKEALMKIDAGLGRLFREAGQLELPGVNYVIVSDHGMSAVEAKDAVAMDELLPEEDVKVVGGGAQMFVYALTPEKIQPVYERLKKAEKHFRVYLKKDIPERYHLRKSASAPDILIDAQAPHTLGFREWMAKARAKSGTHGYDPRNKDMWGIFVAQGPAFKKGRTLPALDNTHVAPLVLKLLSLPEPGPLDGRAEVFAPALRD